MIVPRLVHRHLRTWATLLALVAASVITSDLGATAPNAAEHSIQRFLAQDDRLRAYRAIRRLEAATGNHKGWLEAITEYTPETGFRYEIANEGGSSYIRDRVLRAVLEGERDVIARGEAARSSLALSNYSFHPQGIDGDGLAHVLLSPRRRERALVAGMMALDAADGALVRLQGRLAKSPSFWIKNVDIVRNYERIDGNVVPVALETKAQVRFLGEGTLRMTYAYSHIDGRLVASNR